MQKDTPHPHNTIVKGRIARKPGGEALTLRVLFGPGEIDIPEEGDEARYQVRQDENGTITLTPNRAGSEDYYKGRDTQT